MPACACFWWWLLGGRPLLSRSAGMPQCSACNTRPAIACSSPASSCPPPCSTHMSCVGRIAVAKATARDKVRQRAAAITTACRACWARRQHAFQLMDWQYDMHAPNASSLPASTCHQHATGCCACVQHCAPPARCSCLRCWLQLLRPPHALHPLRPPHRLHPLHALHCRRRCSASTIWCCSCRRHCLT